MNDKQLDKFSSAEDGYKLTYMQKFKGTVIFLLTLYMCMYLYKSWRRHCTELSRRADFES